MEKAKYSIIPKPQSYKTAEGEFRITGKTAVLCVPEFKKAGMYLSSFLKTEKNAGEGAVKFNKDSSIPPEGYRLQIGNDGVVVTASDEKGAFWGAVTLKIIVLQGKSANGVAVLSGADIFDYPKYSYRGGMLDESRHFFGKESVMRLIDNMAMLKLNTLHWHLSDDQGYRIESEVFPDLNEKASKRPYEFLAGADHLKFMKAGGGEYFRYYKKSEIREIVKYAEDRCIEIIPEIDMPGHTVALISAYPQLSCRGENSEVFCENGITEDILCASKESTYEFAKALLGEVCELFPSKYFHIGGDEASKGHNIYEKECPDCKKLMEEKGYKNGSQLQVYFTNEIADFLSHKGKTCIQWNDGMGDETDGRIICQFWTKYARTNLNEEAKKRRLILSPDPYMYFDMSYAHNPLKKTYGFDPARVGLTKGTDSVMGLEFETWTEWIIDEKALEFAIYPRIFALAENAWTRDELKNYKDFYKRLDFFKGYLKAKGVNYSRLEKKKFKVKNRSIYHLGTFGEEYKYNEILKSEE